MFVVVRRLLHGAEVKDLVELGKHLPNIIWLEAAVFHRLDDIATASVIAPVLVQGQNLLSDKAGGAGSVCSACRKTTDIPASTPAGLWGKSERISRQLIPCGPLQIVAVGMARPHLRHG